MSGRQGVLNSLKFSGGGLAYSPAKRNGANEACLEREARVATPRQEPASTSGVTLCTPNQPLLGTEKLAPRRLARTAPAKSQGLAGAVSRGAGQRIRTSKGLPHRTVGDQAADANNWGSLTCVSPIETLPSYQFATGVSSLA